MDAKNHKWSVDVDEYLKEYHVQQLHTRNIKDMTRYMRFHHISERPQMITTDFDPREIITAHFDVSPIAEKATPTFAHMLNILENTTNSAPQIMQSDRFGYNWNAANSTQNYATHYPYEERTIPSNFVGNNPPEAYPFYSKPQNAEYPSSTMQSYAPTQNKYPQLNQQNAQDIYSAVPAPHLCPQPYQQQCQPLYQVQMSAEAKPLVPHQMASDAAMRYYNQYGEQPQPEIAYALPIQGEYPNRMGNDNNDGGSMSPSLDNCDLNSIMYDERSKHKRSEPHVNNIVGGLQHFLETFNNQSEPQMAYPIYKDCPDPYGDEFFPEKFSRLTEYSPANCHNTGLMAPQPKPLLFSRLPKLDFRIDQFIEELRVPKLVPRAGPIAFIYQAVKKTATKAEFTKRPPRPRKLKPETRHKLKYWHLPENSNWRKL